MAPHLDAPSLDTHKLDALDEIYGVYDEYSKNIAVTCKRGCCLCCTQDVTITTLEGRRILKHPSLSQDKDRLNLVHKCQDRLGPQSPISINAFARLCLQGQDTPQENQDIGQKTCIFLFRRQCLIYDDRPFGCRSFFSTQPCQEEESAVVDPFLISVNSVFLQFIEDMDEGGFFGRINNVLSFLAVQDPYRQYGTNVGNPEPSYHRQYLTRNIAMPALMIPPEHEERIEPIVKKLKGIRHKHHARTVDS